MKTKMIKSVFSGFMVAFMTISGSTQGMDSKICCEVQVRHLRCPVSFKTGDQITVQKLKETVIYLWAPRLTAK